MTGSYTPVDLSQLPPPTVVESLDFETIFRSMLSDLQSRDPAFTALVESDPAYKILEVCAYRELILRQRVNDAAKSVMLAYAQGADLDNLGALLGVTRETLVAADAKTGAPAVMESDGDFRHRITLAPESYSVAGPEGAYIAHALSADPDVLDASAISPSPGQVVVSILSRQGNGRASAKLLDTVNAALSAEDVRPLTDQVSVVPAQIVNFSIQATIYTFAGPDASTVLQNSQNSLNSYLSSSHKLGRDITLSAVYGALQTSGVQRVDLVLPMGNISIDRTQAAYCIETAITYGGVDE